MSRKINLKGKKINRLLVIGEAGKNKHGQILWKCLCDCGNVTIVVGAKLSSGRINSCGCYKSELIIKRNITNTKYSKNEKSLYNTWYNMINRCYNKDHKYYKDYGGRGIGVYHIWRESLSNFYNYIGDKPSPMHQLDRIDNNGSYEPGNIQWVMPKNNSRNRRNNRMLSHNGKTMCISEWAEILCVSVSLILGRLKRGWSVKDTLCRPSLGSGFQIGNRHSYNRKCVINKIKNTNVKK